MVQEYRGEPYLTFWAGNDAVGGHGVGTYYMVNTLSIRSLSLCAATDKHYRTQFDRHYELYKKLEGANGLGADLHCFTITTEGTALSTVYEKVQADLSDVTTSNNGGWIWESMFQEVDIETGEAIFQWRASEHVNLTDSYTKMNGATFKEPWDFFHINMIEKDKAGNYLVSSRHLRSILYVSGQTGEVLWRLGGHGNSFEDLSGGSATWFVGQHDAHWANDDHTAITFFDNGADWGGDLEKGSTGMRVAVDLEQMTATLELKLNHPDRIISASQGSYQTLPSGNILLGYGFNGAMAEFSPNGTLLCDAYFAPSSRFTQGDVQSYRDLKFNWTAFPRTSPNMVWTQGSLYVSWNGATEVKKWMFEDSYTGKHNWRHYDSAAKAGFETKFGTESQPIRRYVRAVALDHAGTHLGVSPIMDLTSHATDWESEKARQQAIAGLASETKQDDHIDIIEEAQAEDDDEETSELQKEVEDIQVLIALAFLALVSGLLLAWMTYSWRRKRSMLPWKSVPQDDEEGAMTKMEPDSERDITFWQHTCQGLETAKSSVGDGARRLLSLRRPGADGGHDSDGMLSDVDLSDAD